MLPWLFAFFVHLNHECCEHGDRFRSFFKILSITDWERSVNRRGQYDDRTQHSQLETVLLVR